MRMYAKIGRAAVGCIVAVAALFAGFGTPPANAASDGASAIRAKAGEAAVAARLGAATGGVACGLKDRGCYQQFQRGDIYWSRSTGAHFVVGAIHDEWANLGWENGRLGYPTSDEICGLKDGGCYQNYQGGDIHWTEATGAHMTVGAIHDEWGNLGWENGRLGYPTSDEACGLKDGGCFQHYQGGDIYWTAATGAHMIVGAIREKWGSLGWENGRLGYPTSDEACGLKDGGCFQHYQGGDIYWTAATDAHMVVGGIAARWRETGAENGTYGYPIADEVGHGDGWTQEFQHGTIRFGQDKKAVLDPISQLQGQPTQYDDCAPTSAVIALLYLEVTPIGWDPQNPRDAVANMRQLVGGTGSTTMAALTAAIQTYPGVKATQTASFADLVAALRAGRPVVMGGNAKALPWPADLGSRPVIGHAIAVAGYDSARGVFSVADPIATPVSGHRAPLHELSEEQLRAYFNGEPSIGGVILSR